MSTDVYWCLLMSTDVYWCLLMSTVFLHVGQAGCQIGEAIWPSLFQERTGGQASSSTRVRNLWKPRTKNKHVRQKRARRLQKTENGLVNLWRVKEMLGDVRRTAILNSDRSWILFVKKPWRRQSSLSPGHFGGCRAQGRGSFADASQLKCRVWKVFLCILSIFFPYSFHILFIFFSFEEHAGTSGTLWFVVSIHSNRVFHCFPLFSIVFHCFPLFSIVFHCFPWNKPSSYGGTSIYGTHGSHGCFAEAQCWIYLWSNICGDCSEWQRRKFCSWLHWRPGMMISSVKKNCFTNW